jgi:hypothetical protein
MVNYFTINQYISTGTTIISFNNPAKDGCVGYASVYNGVWTSQIIYLGYYASTAQTWRASIEWDISAIPTNATITLIKFIYHCTAHNGDSHISACTVYRPYISSNTNLYNYFTSTATYINTAGFPVVGANQNITIGASSTATACIDMTNKLSSGWFAIGIKANNEVASQYTVIRPIDYSAANPPPTLYVEYYCATSSTVTLHMCNVAQKTYTRSIDKYLFKDGSFAAHDIGKDNLDLTLAGTEWSTATTRFASIYNMMGQGTEITLSGFDDTTINTDWLIKDFRYNAIEGVPDVYNWNMTLQAVT